MRQIGEIMAEAMARLKESMKMPKQKPGSPPPAGVSRYDPSVARNALQAINNAMESAPLNSIQAVSDDLHRMAAEKYAMMCEMQQRHAERIMGGVDWLEPLKIENDGSRSTLIIRGVALHPATNQPVPVQQIVPVEDADRYEKDLLRKFAAEVYSTLQKEAVDMAQKKMEERIERLRGIWQIQKMVWNPQGPDNEEHICYDWLPTDGLPPEQGGTVNPAAETAEITQSANVLHTNTDEWYIAKNMPGMSGQYYVESALDQAGLGNPLVGVHDPVKQHARRAYAQLKRTNPDMVPLSLPTLQPKCESTEMQRIVLSADFHTAADGSSLRVVQCGGHTLSYALQDKEGKFQ